MILSMDGDEASGWKPRRPAVFLNSAATELEPMFSPDGQWIAYASNETGSIEVWVRPFPGPGGKWLISSGGGASPAWSQSRRELLYASPNGQIMTVAYSADGTVFRPGRPQRWSEGRLAGQASSYDFFLRPFALHPDGDRVASKSGAPTGSSQQDKIVLMFNFFDELRHLTSGTR
jgi:eukaryotic-like serine/threonine-protein kinase